MRWREDSPVRRGAVSQLRAAMAMLAPMKMKCAARKTTERGRKRFMAAWASAMRSRTTMRGRSKAKVNCFAEISRHVARYLRVGFRFGHSHGDPCRSNTDVRLRRRAGCGRSIAACAIPRSAAARRTSTAQNATVSRVEPSMPVKTAMPIDFCALAPAPDPSTSGTTPRMKANDVMRIGRKRLRAAAMAACSIP